MTDDPEETMESDVQLMIDLSLLSRRCADVIERVAAEDVADAAMVELLTIVAPLTSGLRIRLDRWLAANEIRTADPAA